MAVKPAVDMRVVKCSLGIADSVAVQGSALDDAIATLNENSLVVYPTDTLYGLGADPFSERAMARLYAVKMRPGGMPVPIAVRDARMAAELAEIDDRAMMLISTFMPGKLTLVLPKKAILPDFATAGMNNVGLRIPAHPFVMGLTERFGPVTATSANLHGHEEPHDITTAKAQLGDTVELYVDCGVLPPSKPSTIIDLSGKGMRVLREGAVPIGEIEKALKNLY